MANAIPVTTKAAAEVKLDAPKIDAPAGEVKADAPAATQSEVKTPEADGVFTVPKGSVKIESHKAYRTDY